MSKIPPSLYGDGDGVLDPNRPTPREHRSAAQDRLVAEYQRRNSRSPVIAALQRAADTALRRKAK